jgi:branched-chain amino acid transport system ATP-binding protein
MSSLNSSPFLFIENVSKSFRGLSALSNISFQAERGEIIGIIGPNGAGKTTLFQIISGFCQPDNGKVHFDGQIISNKKPYEISLLGIARTFQIVKPLRGLSVLENVMVAPLAHSFSFSQAEDQAFSILKLLELRDKRDVLAEHLTLPEKKRLEVARALATSPKVLLLDEVMAGLRPTEVDRMITILQQVNQQTEVTILMIEHAMRAVMACCSRLVVLHHGEKIAEDTPKAITKHPDVIRSYLGQELC